MIFFVFSAAAVAIIIALALDYKIDKDIEERRKVLFEQVKIASGCEDSKFSVSKYFDRMELESQRIRGEAKNQSHYLLVLWWGDDGLRLNEDGTTEWISKRPKPRNAINPVFNPINTAINADVIQSTPIRWSVESQIQSTEAQIAALQLQLSQCTQSATNSYLIEEIRPAPILGYEPIFARDSSGWFIRHDISRG